MFYKGGVVISDQFVHFIIIQRYSTIVAMIRCNKNTAFFGNFFKGGGSPPYWESSQIIPFFIREGSKKIRKNFGL